MNTRRFSRWFWSALAVVCLTVPFFANKTAANKAATQPQGGTVPANVKTAGGLTVVTFTVNPGTIKVNLPDDMMAGDTISGTVVAEPKGQTPEERATNAAKLREHVVALKPIVDPKPLNPLPPNIIFDLSKGLAQPGGSSIVTGTFTAPTKVNTGLFLMPNQNSPIGPCGRSGSIVAINESCSPISQLVFDLPSGQITVGPSGAVNTPDPKITPPTTPTGAVITPDSKTTPPTHPPGPVITPDPKITPTFIIPPLGQTGTPIVITGPFDGDSSNTILNWTLKTRAGR